MARATIRHFRHPEQAGTITIYAAARDDVPPQAWKAVLPSSPPQGPQRGRYRIVYEKARANYVAYLPDVPGCIATGRTLAQTKGRIRLALRAHIDDLAEQDIELPPPVHLIDDRSRLQPDRD